MIFLGLQSGPAFENPEVVLSIIIVVLLASLGLFAGFFLQRGSRDTIQCHFATELLAIVVTAFTSFLAVATGAVSMSLNEAGGTIGVVTISLVGPAAVWASARALLKWASPLDRLADQDLDVDTSIRTSEERLGWVGYPEWKRRIGRFSDVIEASEAHFIDDLLPKVFYHGHKTTRRLLEPQIRTLFVYRNSKIVKLQSIQGVYDGSGDRPQLYLQSTSSTGEGGARSFHAFQERGAVVEVAGHGNGDWVPTKSNAIDCLVCTLYDNDSVDLGDYLYVDTTKYVEVDPRAYVELCVIADRVPCNMSFWELRSSLSTNRDPVPLIFRAIGREGIEGERATQVACASFGDWIGLLATWRQAQAQAQGARTDEPGLDTFAQLALIDEVWSILGLDLSSGGKDWFKRMTSEDYLCSHLFWSRRQESVLLATFEWEQQAELVPRHGDSG